MGAVGLERLKRVIWRLKETPKDYYLKGEIELAIMQECGTDPRTLKININSLLKLKWIRCSSKRYFIKDKDYF